MLLSFSRCSHSSTKERTDGELSSPTLLIMHRTWGSFGIHSCMQLSFIPPVILLASCRRAQIVVLFFSQHLKLLIVLLLFPLPSISLLRPSRRIVFTLSAVRRVECRYQFSRYPCDCDSGWLLLQRARAQLPLSLSLCLFIFTPFISLSLPHIPSVCCSLNRRGLMTGNVFLIDEKERKIELHYSCFLGR